MNFWKDFNDLERVLQKENEVKRIIDELFNHGRVELHKETLENLFEQNYCFLRIIFADLYKHRFDRDKFDEIDRDFLLMLMYCNLQEEDRPCLEESVVLQTLYVFFVFIENCMSQLYNHDKITFAVYSMGMDKLLIRHQKSFPITSSFLCDFNHFISLNKFSIECATTTINFLVQVAATHFDMIQTLTMFSVDCTPGFLTFVCLASVLNKDYDDDEMSNAKQMVWVYLFTSILSNLDRPVGLTDVQMGILHSNFRSLIRQVTINMDSTERSISLAVTRLIPYYSTSKAFSLLINQLPFELYVKVVTLLVRLTKMKYDAERQKFCFNLLESPYIMCQEETKNEHMDVIHELLIATVWPLADDDDDDEDETAALATIPLLNKIFCLQDKETIKMFLQIMERNPTYLVINVMNYVYQYCSPVWEPRRKQCNQYFISIFCNIYLSQPRIPINSFLQFEQLIITSPVPDLVPCIPILAEVLYLKYKSNNDIVFLITKKLYSNSTSTEPSSIKFLESFFELFYQRITDDPCIYNHLQGCGFFVEKLIEKMFVVKLLKPAVFKQLTVRMTQGERLLQLFDATYGMFREIALPESFCVFCNSMLRKKSIVISPEIKPLSSILSRVTVANHTVSSYEKHTLHVFIDFIEVSLAKRKFNTGLLRSVLLALRMIMDYFKLPSSFVVKTFKEAEKRANSLVNYLNDDYKQLVDSHLYIRDLMYYGEIAAIFGDLKEFKVERETVTIIVHHLKFLNRESYYFEVTEAILKCATILTMRSTLLFAPLMDTLNTTISRPNIQLRIVALHCMYDMAGNKSQNYESVLKYIINFTLSSSREVQVAGFRLFMKLVDKEYTVPDKCETYTILHILARNNRYDLIGKLEVEQLCMKLKNVFERYFTDLLLCSNQIYDHPEFPVTINERTQIPRDPLTSENKEEFFKNLLGAFSIEKKLKLLSELFKNLYLKKSVQFIIEQDAIIIFKDIIKISLIALKPLHKNYHRNDEKTYQATISTIKTMTRETVRESVTADMEYEPIIREIYLKNVLLLEALGDKVKCIAGDVFYLLLATFEWHFNTICNLLISEKLGSEFHTCLQNFEKIYHKWKKYIMLS